MTLCICSEHRGGSISYQVTKRMYGENPTYFILQWCLNVANTTTLFTHHLTYDIESSRLWSTGYKNSTPLPRARWRFQPTICHTHGHYTLSSKIEHLSTTSQLLQLHCETHSWGIWGKCGAWSENWYRIRRKAAEMRWAWSPINAHNCIQGCRFGSHNL